MARFRREAQVLASLNHPNIATIHGLEECNGHCALVMELVEGPTLAEKIRGPAEVGEVGTPRPRAQAYRGTHHACSSGRCGAAGPALAGTQLLTRDAMTDGFSDCRIRCGKVNNRPCLAGDNLLRGRPPAWRSEVYR